MYIVSYTVDRNANLPMSYIEANNIQPDVRHLEERFDKIGEAERFANDKRGRLGISNVSVEKDYMAEKSNEQLVRELKAVANLVDFGGTMEKFKVLDRDTNTIVEKTGEDYIRHATQVYRESYLNPLIKEIARRLKVE